jgi:ankyrin repeat protein
VAADLHWYAESDQVDRLREAIAAGADLSARDDEGRTPLHVAVEHGRHAAVRVLLEAGADLEAPERAQPGYRPLHRACLPRPPDGTIDPELVDLLLEHGAHADVDDARGETPLHLCVGWCDSDLVGRLVGRGARVGARDRTGTTPLHVAVRRGAAAVPADELLDDDGEHGAVVRGRREDTALARLEDAAILEVLLAEGADPNAADSHGVTPLHVAAARGTAWAVRILLEAGASPALTDEWEVTPLHRAATPAVAELLLDAGAPLDAPDRDGATPLHRAVGSGLTETADRLIEAGADLRAVDTDGRTALHLAALAGRGLTVDRLLDEGADPSARDGDGRLPLDLATAGGHGHVVATLKRRTPGKRRGFGFFGRGR